MNTLVPILDFSKFYSSNSIEKRLIANELLSIMQNIGFVMLKGYEKRISESIVSEAFEQTKAFFDLPMEIKDTLAWINPQSNRGYVSQGRERVTQATSAEEIEQLRASAPDYKETMEIGKEGCTYSNQWPQTDDLPTFKPFMNSFFQDCHNLHLDIMSALALGMGLEENFFEEKVNEMAHNLRLLNYPSVEKSKIENGGNRAGAHSDYGSITLLFQDQVGGLEVQDKTGNFIPATPCPNTVVVNIGDLFQRYSNNTLKSTIHRVVLPTPISGSSGSPSMTPKRNSIAFFSNFNLGQIISVLPGVGEALHEPVESETYLVSRLAQTYT